MSDKKEIVKILKENSKGKKIIFAADDDREGEAIAWHTANVLKVEINKENRIIFREISKKAIVKALKKPQKINMNEVNAQQARRIIDRLIGFKLSPCLWKHIQSQEKGLSAGRVQSALLNLLEEREKYIQDYDTDLLLEIKGTFNGLKDSEFIFLKDDNIDDEFIHHLLKSFSEERTFQVSKSTKKKDKTYPKKPFITSTLQQTAQNELGFPVSMTMDIAQKLYENGHITYMRTDSTFISEDFQKNIQSYIQETYESEYYDAPNEKKVKGAQEAHEAIRPTKLIRNLELIDEHKKLYQLIFKRTITSHMKPAEYDVYQIHLTNQNTKERGYFTTNYRQLIFPGYLIYNGKEKEGDKPNFEKEYDLEKCVSSEKESSKPSLYNESSIVNLLEETGIGRPSTYANIIATLGNRKYTVKENIKLEDIEVNRIELHEDNSITEKKTIQKGKILKQRIRLTPLGIKVLKYLQIHFSNILMKEFTCSVEVDLDRIAEGKVNYIDIIQKVYSSFIDIVERQMSLKVNNSTKLLGEKKGIQIFLGKGKYGPYIQIINKEDQKKNMSIEKYLEVIQKDESKFTFEDAIQFLKFPKKINDTTFIHFGPYGYYMKHQNKNYKINQSGKYTEEYCQKVINQ